MAQRHDDGSVRWGREQFSNVFFFLVGADIWRGSDAMGEMRFIASRPENLSDQFMDLAYIAGLDGIPFTSSNRVENDSLVIRRDTTESGKLFFPWTTRSGGTSLLSTASLIERPTPYLLAVELARGSLNRLRKQVDAWQSGGLRIDESILARSARCTELFCDAATCQNDVERSNRLAEECLENVESAIRDLVAQFVGEVLKIRHEATPQLPTLLGATLTDHPLTASQSEAFLTSFNTACIYFNWNKIEPEPNQFHWGTIDGQIEWCMDHNLNMCCGPLIRLESALVPSWLAKTDNFESIRAAVVRFVNAVLNRYGSRVDLFHCFAGINAVTDLPLNGNQQLRLAVDAIETMGQYTPKVSFITSFAQPWCESSVREAIQIPPLHCADTLLRADLGMTGIGLEINYGYHPNGTSPRDLLQINEMIDIWSQLGLPLVIELSAPSSAEEDDQASNSNSVVSENGTVDYQEFVAGRLLPLLLAKPSVHAVIWNQLDDSTAHRFSSGGLFSKDGKPKSSLQLIANSRKLHLR